MNPAKLKHFLLLMLVFITIGVQAKNFYIASSGSNKNNGLTPATAWQTISKLNVSFSMIMAGDSILFKKGETFYGSILLTKSGTNALPIVFSAYGKGARPVITGFTTLTGWSKSDGGIWKKSVPDAGTGLIVVTIDNHLQRLGRYPNADAANGGYLNYTAINPVSPGISAPSLTTSANWTGAEIAVRKLHWVIDRCRVTAHNGNTLSFTNPTDVINSPYPGKAGYGYFFQDDIRTLDQFGEWYLNKSTKDLSVYFGAKDPSAHDIKISTVDILLNCGAGTGGRTGSSYINISNLSFEGANKQAIFARFGIGIIVQNCAFNNNYDAICLQLITKSLTKNNTISNCLNNGIVQVGNASSSATILGDTIKNVGLFAGMGGSGDGNYCAIREGGDNSTIMYNRIDSIGYLGVEFAGNNVKVNYNYISNFCITKDDGGGIYTASGDGKIIQNNREVSYNIICDGVDAPDGTPGNTFNAHGIYLDAGANHVFVHNNTVANNKRGAGIFLNYAKDIQVTNNTLYKVRTGLIVNRMPNTQLLRNIIFTSNIVYPVLSNIFYWNGSLNNPFTVSIQADMDDIFTRIDSNYYRGDILAPFDYFYHLTKGGIFVDPPSIPFPAWQRFIQQELHSSVISLVPSRLEFNSTNTVKAISLDANYIDITGVKYNGSTTLQPYCSLLLTGPVQKR